MDSTPTSLDFGLSLAYLMYIILSDTQDSLSLALQKSRYAHIFAPKATGRLYLPGRRLLVFKALLYHATTPYCGIISGKKMHFNLLYKILTFFCNIFSSVV